MILKFIKKYVCVNKNLEILSEEMDSELPYDFDSEIEECDTWGLD